jgi:hypothetical protein
MNKRKKKLKTTNLLEKKNHYSKKGWGMAQMPTKHEALSSSTAKRKMKEKKWEFTASTLSICLCLSLSPGVSPPPSSSSTFSSLCLP